MAVDYCECGTLDRCCTCGYPGDPRWQRRSELRRRAASLRRAVNRQYDRFGADCLGPDIGEARWNQLDLLVGFVVAAHEASWLGTTAVATAPVPSVPAPAGRPDDEAAPVEPLDVLSTCWPNAPSVALAREARAA